MIAVPARESTFVDEPNPSILTQSPGNGAVIGGLNVIAEHGWFDAPPLGAIQQLDELAKAIWRNEGNPN